MNKRFGALALAAASLPVLVLGTASPASAQNSPNANASDCAKKYSNGQGFTARTSASRLRVPVGTEVRLAVRVIRDGKPCKAQSARFITSATSADSAKEAQYNREQQAAFNADRTRSYNDFLNKSGQQAALDYRAQRKAYYMDLADFKKNGGKAPVAPKKPAKPTKPVSYESDIVRVTSTTSDAGLAEAFITVSRSFDWKAVLDGAGLEVNGSTITVV